MRTPLLAADLSEIANSLEHDREVPLPEKLLADALHFQFNNDHDRALVFAAVACEVKVKETLRIKCAKERRGLLEIIFSKYREIPVAALELFNEVAEATVGCSLKQFDAELNRSIRELFELRNALVHRGKRPDPIKATRIVNRVERVWEWLDAIQPQPNG